MSKRISHAFAVPERKENRTLREKGVRTSYGAPTRHTSATLDFKEWRRVSVFLRRFLFITYTPFCRVLVQQEVQTTHTSNPKFIGAVACVFVYKMFTNMDRLLTFYDSFAIIRKIP